MCVMAAATTCEGLLKLCASPKGLPEFFANLFGQTVLDFVAGIHGHHVIVAFNLKDNVGLFKVLPGSGSTYHEADRGCSCVGLPNF